MALDGKTLRGSFDYLTDRKAIHVLSAFASNAALILARQELAGAPDEIATVPVLTAEPGVAGVLFAADASHGQRGSFAQATATGNALLVRVKDNQPTLHASLAGLCAARRPFIQPRERGPRAPWPSGTPMHRGVRHGGPAGRAPADAGRLRRPGVAPDLQQAHPHRPVGHARGGRTLPPARLATAPSAWAAPSARTGAARTGTSRTAPIAFET